MPDTSDDRIESTLRNIVSSLFSSQDFDSLTLKRVRVDASNRLGFPDEFFKTDVRWKERSKEVVNDEVAKQEAKRGGNGSSSAPKSSPAVGRKSRNVVNGDRSESSKPAPASRTKKYNGNTATAGTKRKAVEKKPPAARKRRKSSSQESESESELTPAEDTSALSDAPSDEEVTSHPTSDSDASDFSDTPSKKRKPPPKKRAPPAKSASRSSKQRAAKAGEQAAVARGKRKTVVSSDEEDEADANGDVAGEAERDVSDSSLSEVPPSPPARKNPPKKADKKPSNPTTLQAKNARTVQDESASETEVKVQDHAASKDTEPTVNDFDSEVSLVYDEPPSKRAKKGQATTKPASKAKPTQPAKSTSPQDEEIKKLQSWLVKCGIRKLWGKELAPFQTSSAKISHLKNMLKEAGMTGRYSEQRAREIKEQRELKADLEDIVEREKAWGESGGEEEEGERPKRRLAKGLKELAEFDDEESD